MFLRYLLICIIGLFSSTSAIAGPVTKRQGDVSYLVCTGNSLLWTESWAQNPFGMKNDKAKIVIKLTANGKKALVWLGNLGEIEFDLTAQPESYYGAIKLNLTVLDGHINAAHISINRIHGEASIDFEVDQSPNNGGKIAFSGSCEPAVIKF